MSFKFRSFQQIIADQVAVFLNKTAINDINPASNVSTFLEASSTEDAQIYFEIYQAIRNYNLDTTEKANLDARAAEYGLTRLPATQATGTVTISDSSIVVKKTQIYAGSRGPVKGQSFIDVNNASGFTPTGTIIIGRPRANAETIAYNNIANNGNFFRITLVGSLSNDHGTDESVTLSQGGNRIIPAGSIVRVPASDVSEEIDFVTLNIATILDGDASVEGVLIQALTPGTTSNVPTDTIIEFDSPPFNTATVTNPSSITNARDRETDPELRDRIRSTIQSLSRGTKTSLLTGPIGLSSDEDHKRVVSVSIIEPVTLDEIVYLYIDDGTGLEPSFDGWGNEIVHGPNNAAESFLQLQHFPIIKAQLETQNSAPYNIINGDTLTIAVNSQAESFIFGPLDFKIPGAVTAYEVTKAINTHLTKVEARTSHDGTKVVIRAKALTNETIQVTGGTANAVNKLSFPTVATDTIYLYKFDGTTLTLLSKDGNTAQIESGSPAFYNLVGGETLTLVVDGKTANPQTVTFQGGDFNIAGSATAQEVVNRINKDLAGAFAFVTSNGAKVTIRSRNTNSSQSKIHITGGAANAILNFSTNEVSGTDKGFSLNRFNGQIELAKPIAKGQIIETASLLTRGFAISANAQPYHLTDGDTIVISIDGGGNQTITFHNADFGDITKASALEVVTAINKALLGGIASVTSDNRIMIQTNTWDAGIGSIQIVSVGGTATAFGFTTGITYSNLSPHVGSIISGNAQNYNFVATDQLVVIVDKDPTVGTYTINMGLSGTVTIGDNVGPFNTFIANITSIAQNFNLKFPNDNDLKDFKITWTSGANNGSTSTVSVYTGGTGQFTLVAGLANAIVAGDTFNIIPVTAKNTALYLNSPITSSLSSKATVTTANNGTKVQISTNTVGTNGAIQVTGLGANTKLNFTTSQIEGKDGYKTYNGIVQKTQYLIDGLNKDLISFPGIKAAGIQVEVLPPIVRLIEVAVQLILEDGISISVVRDQAISAISSYINSLPVGKDVIIDEIIYLLMGINGIADVVILAPLGLNSNGDLVPMNELAGDNEIFRINENDISVS